MDIKVPLGQYFYIYISVDICKPGQRFKHFVIEKVPRKPWKEMLFIKVPRTDSFFFSRINVKTITMNLFTWITCVNSHFNRPSTVN